MGRHNRHMSSEGALQMKMRAETAASICKTKNTHDPWQPAGARKKKKTDGLFPDPQGDGWLMTS